MTCPSDDLTKLSGPELAAKLRDLWPWQDEIVRVVCARLEAEDRVWQRNLERERDGLRERVRELEAKEALVCERMSPSSDPITGDMFFMTMEHPSRGWVATYGGPLDSYTLCERSDDDVYARERYCHDRGAWVELETVDVRVVDNSDFLKAEELDERIAELESQHVERVKVAVAEKVGELDRALVAAGERIGSLAKGNLERIAENDALKTRIAELERDNAEGAAKLGARLEQVINERDELRERLEPRGVDRATG